MNIIVFAHRGLSVARFLYRSWDMPRHNTANSIANLPAAGPYISVGVIRIIFQCIVFWVAIAVFVIGPEVAFIVYFFLA